MALALALAVACFAACDNGLTRGGSAKGASDIEISDPEFGFVKAEEYDPDTFSIDTAHKWTSLDVDSQYYLILTFDVTSAQNNDGQSLLNVDITFDQLDTMDGKMEDVSTGLIEEMTFVDAGSGKLGKTTTVSFKIPPVSTQPKTINMIVQLTPMQAGESHIMIGYRFDPSTTMASADSYRLLGSDGYTKNLKIISVQIEKPQLSVDDMGTLIWNNVKNADYYLFYKGSELSEPFTDESGEILRVDVKDENGIPVFGIGDEMSVNMGDYVVGFAEFRIRAFSNNENIIPSSFSNSVSFIWL